MVLVGIMLVIFKALRVSRGMLAQLAPRVFRARKVNRVFRVIPG